MKKGLLLINLGTPNHPDPSSVRRYLREFLIDKRVITLPAALRYLLLYGFILPFRAKQTARAYQHIWTSNGSPLRVNSLALQQKVQSLAQDEYIVSFGMRYGEPSIKTALTALSSCADITVLPLYPQYSSAATGSSIEKVLSLMANQISLPSLTIIRDFHQHSDFIAAVAATIKPYVSTHDYILFSYHGLPEQHLIQGGCRARCQTACPAITASETACYRAQSFQTTRSIVKQLELDPTQYSTSFQSRLGKTPWIQPYTDDCLIELANRGIKRLAVTCPSFVADCVETLEEIGIRAKKQWLSLGGEQLTLIPCVNDSDLWAHAILNIIR